MKKENQLTFYKADFAQYWYLLEDDDIREKVSSFLLKYVSVEAFYKKLLVSYKERNGQKVTQEERQNFRVRLNEVKATLKYFNVQYDSTLINRIFDSDKKANYMNCSIKVLRDRLVHNVNDNVLRIILERYDSINSDLDNFVNYFSI